MENEANKMSGPNEEMMDQLFKKVNELDKLKNEQPGFAASMETLKGWLEDYFSGYTKSIDEIKTEIQNHHSDYPASDIQAQLEEVKSILNKVPKNIPVKHSHYFDPRSNGWIISGTVILLGISILTGLSMHLWVENSELAANNIKFRMLRQTYPAQANLIEDLYYKDPAAMEAKIIELEDEALRRSEAQGRIDRAEREIREAKKQLRKKN